ncbi:transferase, partial [Streptomyces sp. H036]
AVLIMYFWSGLIAFGTVAYSVHSPTMLIVLLFAALSAVGLIPVLLPRFPRRPPTWAEGLVTPRSRPAARAAEAAGEAAAQAASGAEPVPARPIAAGVSGVN